MAKRYVGKNDDLRVRKTKRAIEGAALELLREDPSRVPSVKSIIGRANVNKSTFYYHYESVQDLLDRMEQEAFDDVMARAVGGIGTLANDPARFVADFGAFVYDGSSMLLAGSGRLKTSVFEGVLASACEGGDGIPLDPAAVEVVLLGLWGYTRRASKAEYDRSAPVLAAMLERGIAGCPSTASAPSSPRR